jgi:hypothetical protein
VLTYISDGVWGVNRQDRMSIELVIGLFQAELWER